MVKVFQFSTKHQRCFAEITNPIVGCRLKPDSLEMPFFTIQSDNNRNNIYVIYLL